MLRTDGLLLGKYDIIKKIHYPGLANLFNPSTGMLMDGTREAR